MGTLPPPVRPWWIRLLASLVIGIGTAVLVAITLAIIDLYLSGHGLRPLNASWLEWPAAGVHLSRADVIFLVAAVLATAIAWRRMAAGDA